MRINEWVNELHSTAHDKGWWDDDEPNIPEKLALIHSEISEALEEFRNGNMETYFVNVKPEGFAVELADAVIRIMDLCGYLGIDLESTMMDKAAYNKTRAYRHGGKKA